MANLTSQDKVNISTFLAEVLLADLLDEALRSKQNQLSDQQTLSFVASLFASIPNLGAFLAVPVTASGIAFLMGLFTGNEVETIRSQADNVYWLEVKRQLHCTLPNSYTDPAWLRDRLARSIENIVPFNNRSSLKLRTQANAVVAQALRVA
jgi:hypothetical protein